MKFLDIAKITIRSGDGGNGCVSFRRERYIEFGGPDGGNGGNGGNVLLEAVDSLNTLIDFRYQQHFFAGNGSGGMGKQRSGRNGDDITLKVPVGTEVLDEDNNIIADMIAVGQKVTLLKGGNGGFGNLAFKSSTNRAPRKANPGLNGIEAIIIFKLKLIADIGLLGMPNAGKSTFLASTSNAKPKIADYPFTTLVPNLGVVKIDNSELVIADIPGLIKGASSGKGIGDKFLSHIERSSILMHIIDCTSENIVEDYKIVINELRLFSEILSSKPKLTVLNKIDAIDSTDLKKKIELLSKESGSDIYCISGISKEGVSSVLRSLQKIIAKNKVFSHKKDSVTAINAEKTGWEP